MGKVFCIGMFKTGTSTMGAVFQCLGYQTLNGPWWPKDIMIFDDWYKTPEKWNNYRDVIKNKTEQYDAFQDYPWMFCFEMCYEWYPDAKFIFSSRDSEKVADSDINMWRKEGVPEDKILDRQVFIDRYENQYNRAIEFFKDKPGSLLVLGITENPGCDEICKFLNKPVPNIPFPHTNKGVYRV